MKKLNEPVVAVLLFLLLVACRATPTEQPQGLIQSGDEIDGMVFSPHEEPLNWDISLYVLCDQDPFEKTEKSASLRCSTLPGAAVFFGNCGGVLYKTPEEADEQWQDLEIAITFDDQALDLPSFGFIDTEFAADPSQALRMWNLTVENVTPGTHTIRCVEENEGEPFTATFVLEVSESQGTFSLLSGGAESRIHPYTTEDGQVNYLLFIPDNYGVDQQLQWPLLVILHGRSRVYSDVMTLGDDYPLNTLTEDGSFPFIVVAPKSKIDPEIGGDYNQWATDYQVQVAMTVLDEVQAELSIDPNRVYLTGGSGGGNGVWVIGLHYPNRFAALVPFMGYYGWPFTVPENICDLKDIPVWAFHGDADEVVPIEAEQMIVDALEACGGDVQFTIFPGAGHDLEYDLVYNSELYEWLLR